MRVRAIAIRRGRIIAMGVGRRERLVVRVPLLLLILRHAVLEGRARIVVSVLWFRVTTFATADVIPTGWKVVISVWLLRVISLLGVVGHGLRDVSRYPPCVVCAVRILLKDLVKENKRGRVLMTAVGLHKHKTCKKKKNMKLDRFGESNGIKSSL